MKKVKLEDQFKEFLAAKEASYETDDNYDCVCGFNFKWFDVTDKGEGVLMVTDVVFEGSIYDDTIECEPRIYVCPSIDSDECRDAFKDELGEWYEREGFETEDEETYTLDEDDDDEDSESDDD